VPAKQRFLLSVAARKAVNWAANGQHARETVAR
jgi:hypothetical protein